MKGPSWFDQVKGWPAGDVATRFGLEIVRRGADVSFPCPVCLKARRHTKGSDKRAAAKVTHGGSGWWCEPCGEKGSAVDLAAAVVTGKTGDHDPAVWADVRRACAELGLCDADQGDGRPPPARAYVPPPPMPPAAPLERLPSAEVAALWAASARLDSVPPWDNFDWCGEARRFIASRALDVATLAMHDAARILPPVDRYSWPAWWPSSWSKVWRVVVPLFDASGAMVALQARAIVANDGPKTRNPMGSGVVAGTFFADQGGLEVLRGSYAGPGVTVVEGLTDYLAAAQLVAGLSPERRPAALGIVAGSARALVATNVKTSWRLNVLTDNDEQGERYFREVVAALPALDGFRVRLEPLEGKRADLGDYLRQHRDMAVKAVTCGMEQTHGE